MGRTKGPSAISYLFIDGAYLQYRLLEYEKECLAGDPFAINYQNLAFGFQKIFYYDALPFRKDGEDELAYEARVAPVVALHNKLRRLNGFHVYEGTTKAKRKETVQKGIDVMIAVHMMMHSYRGNMDNATLLAGDLDFKPLVDALVQDGMNVTVWSCARSESEDLVRAADLHRRLTLYELLTFCKTEFKLKHGDLQVSGCHINPTDQIKFDYTGVTAAGRKAGILKANGRLIAMIPSDDDECFGIQVAHPNRETLETAIRDQGLKVTWDKS